MWSAQEKKIHKVILNVHYYDTESQTYIYYLQWDIKNTKYFLILQLMEDLMALPFHLQEGFPLLIYCLAVCVRIPV